MIDSFRRNPKAWMTRSDAPTCASNSQTCSISASMSTPWALQLLSRSAMPVRWYSSTFSP